MFRSWQHPPLPKLFHYPFNSVGVFCKNGTESATHFAGINQQILIKEKFIWIVLGSIYGSHLKSSLSSKSLGINNHNNRHPCPQIQGRKFSPNHLGLLVQGGSGIAEGGAKH